MKTIAIVGFGFCGKMVFANLAKSLKKNYKILIFDKSEEGFASAAFAQFSPHYILNVPANKMSAFGDDQKNFCQFLNKKYPKILPEITESGFAPRQIYSEYLQEILDKTLKSKVDFKLINQEVLSITGDQKFEITTQNNQKFFADEIVLATSFVQSKFPWKIESQNVVESLWNKNFLWFHQKKFADEKICLIGSGLTTVDVIVGLKNKNFTGEIFVISRRGNFPKKHFTSVQKLPDFISVADAKKGVLFLCLKVRKFLRDNPQFDLRHVVDSVRPITQDLWHNFDQKNKKLFLRLFPYWNIFRHRAPANSIEIIEKMIATKQLKILNGGVKSLSKINCHLERNEGSLISCHPEHSEGSLTNCHSEHSEGSQEFRFQAQSHEILHCVQDDNLLKISHCVQDDNLLEILRCAQDDNLLKISHCTQDDNLLEILRCSQDDSLADEKILVETKSEKFETDYLVNCLGFEFRAEKYPLLNQMISQGLLKADLMMAQSNNKKIHLLGGLNIGRDFECTAVPDLRVDVEKIIPVLCSD